MTNRVFAICSGTGGVGRSTLAVALALRAAESGRQTVLLDASGVSRSCDLLLGVESAVTLDLADVLTGQASLERALCRAPQQPKLRYACASLFGASPIGDVLGAALALRSMAEALVVDLPAGELMLGAGLMGEGDARVVLARPDDASLRAAERMLALCAGERAGSALVLSRVKREQVKRGRQYGEDAAAQLLDTRPLGVIPEDDAMAAEVGKGKRRFLLVGAARAQLDKIADALLKGEF